MDCDLLIQNATIVTETKSFLGEVAVANEKIVAIGPDLNAKSRETINAQGLHLFSAIIDAHVHFNEPGRESWEGLATGSQALAAGGGTLFFDMPLNSDPPVLNVERLHEKAKVATQKSYTDFAFWGGLVPGNLDHLEALADEGVIGFKAFMSDSGIAEFSRVDLASLKKGMQIASRSGKIVAVHAESETMTAALTQRALAEKRFTIRDYLNSRPIASELEAIQKAIELAAETGCALHVVHVSCAEGIALITSAKQKGVNVSCETCPHYLVLTEEDVEKLGAIAKCAPPVRSREEKEKLWNELKNDRIDIIGSDHSPCPPEMKQKDNFFQVWGGISGVQHTFSLLTEEGMTQRHVLPEQLTRWLSTQVADRFQIFPQKGRLNVGSDADFFIADLNAIEEVTAKKLFYRHPQSPYIGRQLRGKVVRTFLRGHCIFQDGKMVGNPIGKWVKPVGL
ncbi:MAG: allantoinase AllB [Verrucomicrobiae bacterium]|nr:allantoinase AllB [Verrucomicrobiae bacterium]